MNSTNLNPLYVNGFTDAEGCFTVSFSQKSNLKWAILCSFEIELHAKDIAILYTITDFFGVGSVFSSPTLPKCRYRVNKIDDLTKVIIPHFIKFPLLTQKSADFFLFKMVVELMLRKEHLTSEGLLKIISIKASINKGLTDTLKSNFPNITPVVRPIISLPSILDPYWVLGFCDGESNFYIKIYPNNRYSSGSQVRLVFRVSQHNRDTLLLTKLVEFFNCGLMESFKDKPAVTYVVAKFKDINTNIIPFFEKYSLMGIKKLDFQDFSKVAMLISSDEHKTTSGLAKIKTIKAGTNSKRTF